MTQQLISTTPGSATTAPAGGAIINSNFSELYTSAWSSTTITVQPPATGYANSAIQAAIDFIALLGGGIVQLVASTYATGSLTVTDTTLAPVTAATIPRAGTGVGTLCYVAIAVATSGQQSAPSNEACKTVAPPPPTPNPPTGLAPK